MNHEQRRLAELESSWKGLIGHMKHEYVGALVRKAVMKRIGADAAEMNCLLEANTIRQFLVRSDVNVPLEPLHAQANEQAESANIHVDKFDYEDAPMSDVAPRIHAPTSVEYQKQEVLRELQESAEAERERVKALEQLALKVSTWLDAPNGSDEKDNAEYAMEMYAAECFRDNPPATYRIGYEPTVERPKQPTEFDKALDEAFKAHIIISERLDNKGNEVWNFDDVRDSLAECLRLKPELFKRLKAEIAAEKPQYTFPDDDAELEGEMFEDDDGEVMTVLCRSPLQPYRPFYCEGDDGRWIWLTANGIRKHNPLGPSPRKRLEQAKTAVCKAATALNHATDDNRKQLLLELSRASEAVETLESEQANDS